MVAETGFTALGLLWAYELLYNQRLLERLRCCCCRRRTAAAEEAEARGAEGLEAGGGGGAAAAARHGLPLLAGVGYLYLRRQLAHSLSPKISAADNPVPG